MDFASITSQRYNGKVEELSPFRYYLIAQQDSLMKLETTFMLSEIIV